MNLFSMSGGLFLFCKYVHLYTFFFNTTYKQCQMTNIFVWFISLSMIISRAIHIAANEISLFLMAELYVCMCIYIIYIYVCVCVCIQSLQSCRLFVTPWTVAHQAPQEWVFMPSSRGSSQPREEPMSLRSPPLGGRFFIISTWEAYIPIYIKCPLADEWIERVWSSAWQIRVSVLQEVIQGSMGKESK